MSELAKHLPLSQGERSDDSAVSGDWAPARSLVLYRIVALIEKMPAEQWSAADAVASGSQAVSPAMSPAMSPAEASAVLLWRLRTPAAERRAALRRELPRHPLRRAAALERTLRAGAAPTPAGPSAELRELAAQTGQPPARVGELAAAVCAALDIASVAGEPAGLAPLTSGAVALYQAQRAPYAARAAVRGRRLHAVDADWSVGRGEVIDSDAETILRFLFGRGTHVPGS